MNTVKVNKTALQEKVTKNRSEHRKIFEEAVEGYRAEAVRLLEEHIKEVKNGKLRKVSISLPFPEDHTIDYDRVLTMLDMSVDDEVVLQADDFAAYVMDDWHWKRQFLTTNSAYSVTAAGKL